MRKINIRGHNYLFLTVVAVLICTVPLLGGVKGDIKKSFKVSPGGLLKIDADLGSIEVRSGSGNKVDVERRAFTEPPDVDALIAPITSST